MRLGLRAEGSFAAACGTHAILITPHKAPAAVWGYGGNDTCYGVLKTRNYCLFNPNISSLYGECEGFGPAYTCASGFKRMVKVLKQIPQQYELLVTSLKRFVDDYSVNGVDLLEEEYKRQ